MARRLFNLPECSETLVKINVCEMHRSHCVQCGSPTSAGGHFVGGSRPDARVICDPVAREAYLALIKDTASPGRRYRDEGGV
ncbi:hypothetical protein SEA_GALACTICA_56 [Streptomyces phage Galactica]|nr:hypothetical protein SEA_GALACTICA_56 [Streptomyces phage Galactica]